MTRMKRFSLMLAAMAVEFVGGGAEASRAHLPVDPQAVSNMGMGDRPEWAVQNAPVAEVCSQSNGQI